MRDPLTINPNPHPPRLHDTRGVKIKRMMRMEKSDTDKTKQGASNQPSSDNGRFVDGRFIPDNCNAAVGPGGKVVIVDVNGRLIA